MLNNNSVSMMSFMIIKFSAAFAVLPVGTVTRNQASKTKVMKCNDKPFSCFANTNIQYIFSKCHGHIIQKDIPIYCKA